MSGILRHFGRRRFATGGVGMSDPRVQIPERAPGSLTPATPSLSGPSTGGREYHPLADADYYTYGQTGGEHEFFTGNLPVAPLQPNNLPGGGSGGGGGSSGGGGAAGVLGDLTQLAGAAKTAGQLANMAGIDNAYTKAMQNPIGAAKDYFGAMGANSALASTGSGAAANSALADAGFGANWTTPVLDVGGAAGGTGILGSLGTGADTAAAFGDAAAFGGAGAGAGAGAAAGAGGAGSATGAGGAATAGLGAGLASAGAGALAAAGIILPIMDEFNYETPLQKQINDFKKMAQYDSHSVRQSGLPPEIEAALDYADAGTRQLAMNELNTRAQTGDWIDLNPYVNQNGLSSITRTPTGRRVQAARGGSLESGPPGVLAYTQDPKYVGPVRGKGTGRSDEIPARLSDGEYVMDAETVAMLGDGSTDAGAKKLDQMRARLRAHKGKKLARGKFSDNAKDPMEYIK